MLDAATSSEVIFKRPGKLHLGNVRLSRTHTPALLADRWGVEEFSVLASFVLQVDSLESDLMRTCNCIIGASHCEHTASTYQLLIFIYPGSNRHYMFAHLALYINIYLYLGGL